MVGADKMINRLGLRAGLMLAAAIAIASCSNPDASGIYVYRGTNEVALVQLVETKEGTVTGRYEGVTVDSQGNVRDQSASLDGATSGNDLMFKPSSVWLGGVNASGSFDRGGLTLSGQGFSLEAGRSSLQQYQAAVADLREKAARTRQRLAEMQRQQAIREAEAQREQAARDAEAEASRNRATRALQLEEATAALRAATANLSAALTAAPDFGQAASANTAKISRMAQIAPTLSVMDRNRMVAAANQVIVGTNQIEVARSQYAMKLNQLLQQAAPLAERVQQFCQSGQGASFVECQAATAAASDFKGVVARGIRTFGGDRQTVQDELARQSSLVGRMGG
jgi:hypothetical protein